MAHSDSLSPVYLGMWLKLYWRCELKIGLTGSSARRSQQTLIIPLGLPGLNGILPRHLIQLTTRKCDQLTAQLLSSPECPLHTATNLMIQL